MKNPSRQWPCRNPPTFLLKLESLEIERNTEEDAADRMQLSESNEKIKNEDTEERKHIL